MSEWEQSADRREGGAAIIIKIKSNRQVIPREKRVFCGCRERR